MTNSINGVNIWEYKPITDVGLALRNLNAMPQFRELRNKHQMIDDAWGELETVVKLHEDIDTNN